VGLAVAGLGREPVPTPFHLIDEDSYAALTFRPSIEVCNHALCVTTGPDAFPMLRVTEEEMRSSQSGYRTRVVSVATPPERASREHSLWPRQSPDVTSMAQACVPVVPQTA
jgi:hypothetical protein